MTPPGPGGSGQRATALAWTLLAALLLYSVAIFYGIGVPAGGTATQWYEPRAFLLGQEWSAPHLQEPIRALAWIGIPALVLASACIRANPSALARALSASAVVACLLFTFYGVAARGVWEFFGWRASAVLWLLALCLGFALTAPLLASSWLRLAWPARLALYLPPSLVAVAFVRNATGTDPALPFSISPWPAVPVFGVETGALLAVAWQTGAALGLSALGVARRRSGTVEPVRGAIGIALALAASAGLLLAAGSLELVPFVVDGRTLLPTLGAGALTIAVVAGFGGHPTQNARRLGTGAALIALPLFAGAALARWDYHTTRERDARAVIEALERYFEREQLYPDTLEQLVESGDLERIPTPSIGFSLLSDAAFRYENFGTSFLLEFQAPRWVECAYTPPFQEEDDPGASLDEAWSCPSEPPELW